MNSVIENIRTVRDRITAACQRVDRDPATVTLIAVSKMVDATIASIALSTGVIDLGESRVQEARNKYETIGVIARWHMIGPLQTNKAKYCPGLFSLIHSIDRGELMVALSEQGEKRGIPMEGLLQINVGGETQKSGCHPNEAADLLRLASSLSHLTIRGVMTIPPATDDPEERRPFYQKLVAMRDELEKQKVNNVSLGIVSAGMTDDYEVAIEEGATMVRVGTAIFGSR